MQLVHAYRDLVLWICFILAVLFVHSCGFQEGLHGLPRKQLRETEESKNVEVEDCIDSYK